MNPANTGQIQAEAPLPPPPPPENPHIGPRHVVNPFVRHRNRNRPIRPKTAFIFFSNDHRYNVRRDNPQLSIPNVGRRLGEMWRAKTAAERRPYEERAQRDRERYWREKRQWFNRPFRPHPWVRPPHQPV